MPITYAVKKVKNPNGIEGTNYFHGQAIKTGELTMDKLARRINNSTTVTQGDCYAVLKSMKEHIIEALTEGQVVVLDDLGRFQITLQGKCYPEEAIADKEFSPSAMIKGHKIVFRPDATLKKEVARDFKLQRISSEAMK
jgi:predicted histone-like DNA-binding protein